MTSRSKDIEKQAIRQARTDAAVMTAIIVGVAIAFFVLAWMVQP